MTAQSIKLPPHLAAFPTSHLTLPPPLTTTTTTHTPSCYIQTPHTVSPQTPRPTSSLGSNRGGSDELPQKSYGCFSLTGDSFKPSLSVFMFFLFCPCLDFCFKFKTAQSLQAVSTATFPSSTFYCFFKNKIYTKVSPQNRVPLCWLYVCLFCYIGVSTERTVI